MTAERDLAGYLDHTLLAPDATAEQIERLCAEAQENGFAAVCVNGVHVARCADLLAASEVRVASTVGFPLGAMAPRAKAYEAERAVADGARELDVVIQVGALVAGDDALVLEDLAAVCSRAAEANAVVKAILETSLLTPEQKERACELAVRAGAGFVKTSTGTAGGATVQDVALLRAHVPDTCGVKAAGGIRSADDARRMLAAGATRIGTSSALAIVGA